jgi:Protein of unknown function (DUF3574)
MSVSAALISRRLRLILAAFGGGEVMRPMVALVVFTALSGCASLPQACLPPAQPMTTAEMLFGRNIGNHVGVSEADFAQFTAREITPRFPDGLTVVDARGQWRDAGTIVREPSKLVLITFSDDPQKRASLDAIVDAYKLKFRQKSVLSTIRTSCVSFHDN